MPYVDEPRCKICSSVLRSQIDKQILGGTHYDKIIEFAKKRGLDIEKHNLSRHKLKHLALAADEIEAKAQEEIEKKRREELKQREREDIKSHADNVVVLQEIIDRAYTSMLSGAVTPTLTDALRAVELQAKLKEGHNLESSLLEFMMQFTREDSSGREKAELKIINTRLRPPGIVNALEDFSGAKIRKGEEAIAMAQSENVRSNRPDKMEKPQPESEKTVDDTLPEVKKVIAQYNLFDATPEVVEELQ